VGSKASIPVRSIVGMGATPEPAALASAAHALCDNGYLAEAETLSRWLVHAQPHFSGGRVVLGRVLFEMERLDEAADVLRATTIQYPASVAAYRWLGEVLVRQGLWARAKAVLNQAAKLSPANRRISQLQRLAGQEGERADVVIDDSTTRAMDIPARPNRRVLPPPIPVQGLSRKERGNRLSEADATPTGIAPPETPLYARADFGHAPFDSAQWPKAPTTLSLVAPQAEPPAIQVQRPLLDIENTPSVTWKGIPMLDQHWKRRWHKGAGWLMALAATGFVGFMGVRLVAIESTTKVSKSSLSGAHEVAVPSAHDEVPNVDQWLHIASLESLQKVLASTNELKSKESNAARDLADALLLLDYGVVRAPESTTISESFDEASDMSLAAKSLRLLAEGNLDRARDVIEGVTATTPDQPWIALAQAKVMQRIGNNDAARTFLGNPTQSPVTAMLAAELALDEGRPAESIQMLSPLAISFPQHPRLAALLEEANDNLHPSAQLGDGICTPELGPNLFARCSARAASVLRRKGLPDEASRRSLSATHEQITDPRTAAATALVLSNLGHSDATAELRTLLTKTTGPAFSGRAWSEFARLMSRDAKSAAALVPAQNPATPEERLLFVRAAYAAQGSKGLAAALNTVGVDAIKADEDLRWWRMLTQFKGSQALTVSTKLLAAKHPLGPVGTFVAGLLANDSRRLTSHWMSRALATSGHGDRCWAASQFATAQLNLGTAPEKLAAYRNLIESNHCERRR
jgi:tetratricopeptide (TPR) repeat protein